LVKLNKGDLVRLHPRYTKILKIRGLSKITSEFCLFLEYGQNTSCQQLKSLSKVLIENRIIQLPTNQINKVKIENDTKI